jgi:cytochrome b
MSTPASTRTTAVRNAAVRVWDLPTRLFHWALALCVIGLFITGSIGGNALTWHMRLGYTVFALLAFRVVWGFIGGRWSRFASFVYAPATLLRYLRGHGRPEHDVGHSPLGALSVFAMLALLAAQVGTGLFVDDEIGTTGPLSALVSTDTALALTSWHRFGRWLILALVVLHIGAIMFYRVKRGRDLIGPMIHGDKPLADAALAATDSTATRGYAAVLIAACAAAVYWVVGLGSP